MGTTSDPNVPDVRLYELAFDQFSRQYLVKSLIEKARSKTKLRILDVGGLGGKTREFFPNDNVLVIDLYDKTETNYQKADALAMPFADHSFDFVVSFDVYEHILPADRPLFVTELIRVSRQVVFIAAPFNTQSVESTENELNAFYRSLHDKDHPWLAEHIANILPEMEPLEKQLDSLGMSYSVSSSNNLLLWSHMQGLIFLADSLSAPERLSKLNSFYNQHLLEMGDGLGASYRQIYAISKNIKTLPNIQNTMSLNDDTLRSFINLTAITIRDIVYGSGETGSQAAELAKKDRELTELRSKLEGINASRPYKLARSITKAKNRVFPK
jgi:hypothetical protein